MTTHQRVRIIERHWSQFIKAVGDQPSVHLTTDDVGDEQLATFMAYPEVNFRNRPATVLAIIGDCPLLILEEGPRRLYLVKRNEIDLIAPRL